MIMKKSLVLAIFALAVFAVSASAQKAADFSGKWNLDLSKSELGQQGQMIKSQTLTITQNGTSFKTSTQTERNAPPEDAGGGGGGGGRPGGGGFGGAGGGGEQSYTLDGKEVSTERQGPNGPLTIKTKAEQSGSKITITVTTPGQNGDVTTKSTYELSSDGKGLTVTRENPRGTTKSVYTKG